jgi:stage II sporulation protein D
MRRGAFLGLAAGALAVPSRTLAQTDADPAQQAPAQGLRVLLGTGPTAPGPGPDGFLYDGNPYRGSYVRLRNGAVVNVVDLEAYLYSVVPREMAPNWPAAALQAQAVCARTYVLQRSNPRRAYDLVPSEADQVYLGVRGESPAGRAAVEATTAQVLQYAGRYAWIAYSSCCGGHTESSADAWGGTPLPYLRGVACGYCTASPNYRWTVQIPLAAIAAAFAAELAAYGDLRDVQIAQTDPSGRARGFELIGSQGSVVIKGSTFRMRIGPRVLRSLLVSNLRNDSNANVVLEGGGLGHGVGMCQWGARGMALAGRSARDVLAFYFPGTQITTND